MILYSNDFYKIKNQLLIDSGKGMNIIKLSVPKARVMVNEKNERNIKYNIFLDTVNTIGTIEIN